GFDNTTPASFRDALADLRPDGSFALDRTRLEQIHGGPLADGPHTLHLQARDAAGSLSDVTDLAFTLDTSVAEPAFDLLPPSDTPPVADDETASPTADLGGQTEAGAVVILEGTGFRTTADAGRFTFHAVPLAEGPNTLTARVIDIAGNENSSRRTFQRLL